MAMSFFDVKSDSRREGFTLLLETTVPAADDDGGGFTAAGGGFFTAAAADVDFIAVDGFDEGVQSRHFSTKSARSVPADVLCSVWGSTARAASCSDSATPLLLCARLSSDWRSESLMLKRFLGDKSETAAAVTVAVFAADEGGGLDLKSLLTSFENELDRLPRFH